MKQSDAFARYKEAYVKEQLLKLGVSSDEIEGLDYKQLVLRLAIERENQ